ncbi:MAG TPA: VWA domain-containing protein, partial [Thermoanaerobaculia bacterium]|nr:VWA domain-containing protein [Thermoanaerobaculia bacterium]
MFARKSWLRVSTTYLVLAFAALALSAQQSGETSQEEAPETFGGTVNVQVVNVDVHVTDRHGKIVTGLKKSDFELFEDGRPVKITNFYAENGRAERPARQLRVEAPPASGQAKNPAPETAEGETANLPDRQRLWVVFFIDNLSLRPPDRTRVLRQLHEFVDQAIGPGDHAMVVAFDRSMKVLQPFTSDRYSVLQAFDKAERLSAEGVHAEENRNEVLKALHDAKDPADAIGRVDSYSGSLFNDVDTTIRALTDFIHSLSGLEGRKALVYVSDGLPQRAGLDAYYALRDKFRQATSLQGPSRYDSTHSLDELAAAANTARVVFYTLDAGGLRVRTDATAEQFLPTAGDTVDSDYISNRQSSLQLLARQTGGQAVINTNDVRAPMRKVKSDLSTFYSLGFTPVHEGDGRYHRITVKVKKRGLRLRYRQGYRDQPEATRMIDATLAALKFGETTNPLKAGLSVGEVKPDGQGDYVASIILRVPLDQITAIPLRDGSRQVQLRLFVVLRSPDGTTPVHQVPVKLRITAEEWKAVQSRSITYPLKLTVSPGGQLLTVG